MFLKNILSILLKKVKMSQDAPAVLSTPLSDAVLSVSTIDGLIIDPITGYQVSVNSPYELNIQKKQTLFSSEIKRISLVQLCMPYTSPNVNPYNNIMYFVNASGIEESIVITPGFYLPSELAAAIQTAMNTSTGSTYGTGVFGKINWLVSWDSRNNTFSIDNQLREATSIQFSFTIVPKLNKSKGFYTDIDGSVIYRSSTLAEMMGFNAVSDTVVNKIYGSFPSMTYTKYIDIVSTRLCGHQRQRDTSTDYKTGNNILGRIYIAPDRVYSTSDTNIPGTRPFFINFVPPVPKNIRWEAEEFLPSIDIRLQDDKGNLLYALPAAATTPAVTPDFMYSGNTAYFQANMLISETK